MTLFTAEGLLRACVRGKSRGMCDVPSVVSHAYLRWLLTQGMRPAKTDDEMGDGWLFQQRALHSRRAPGHACLTALKAAKAFGDPACNDSKGCGGVMRAAPVGLMGWSCNWDAQEVFRTGIELAALTHGHPTGQLPAGVLAVLILALIDGASLQEGLAAAKGMLKNEARHSETTRAVEAAEALAASSAPPHEAIAQLGQGWIAEEALAVSIYCALTAGAFRQGVILAVNHDGDSDSTGSITGNLLGAMHGVKAIPAAWLEPLELRDVIAEMAEDLHACRDWGIGEFSENREFGERIWRKYPGW
jgi:ADP-ribosylglycohydrolase